MSHVPATCPASFEPHFPISHPPGQICGTPGTGKTSLAELLATRLGYSHLNVSRLVTERCVVVATARQHQLFC